MNQDQRAKALLIARKLLFRPVEDPAEVRVVHIFACSVRLNKGSDEGFVITMISRTEHRDNSLGSLFCVVEGYLGEQVVDDMVVDNVVEEVAADEAKVTIDSGQRTVDK